MNLLVRGGKRGLFFKWISGIVIIEVFNDQLLIEGLDVKLNESECLPGKGAEYAVFSPIGINQVIIAFEYLAFQFIPVPLSVYGIIVAVVFQLA